MAITAETRNDIIELVVTAYDAAPGTTLLTELVAIVDAGGTLADVAAELTTSARWNSLYPSFLTAEEFANEWLGNLVPEASADALAEGVSIAVGLINGGASFADLIIEAQSFLSAASETDASFGTSAARFNNKVEVATYHTVTQERDGSEDQLQSVLAEVTSDDASVTAAQAVIDNTSVSGITVTLTDDVEDTDGTSGDDTFKAILDGTDSTLQSGDIVDGLAGTDRLDATLTSSGITAGTEINNVENFFLRNVSGASQTSNFALVDDSIMAIWNNGSIEDSDVVVTNVGNAATVGVLNTDTDTSVTFTSAAAVETINVALSGADGGDITIGGGAETIVVNSGGTGANEIGTLDDAGSNDFVTLNITGDQDLEVGGIGSSVTSVDSSALTGDLEISVTGAASANDFTFVGGAGNDQVTVSTTDEDDNLDGGDGIDTLVVAGTFGATLTGFEVLARVLAAGTVTIDLEEADEISTISISGASSAAITALALTNLNEDQAISISSDVGTQVDGTVTLEEDDGSSDTLSITVSGNGAVTQDADLIIGEVEELTLTFNTTAGVTIDQMIAEAAATESTAIELLTLAGTDDITIDLGAAHLVDVADFEIDASAVEGDVVIDGDTGAISATDAAGGSLTISTGGGNDRVDTTTTDTASAIISTGNGNDDIDTGDGDDEIDGGAGNDTINSGGGDDEIEGGSGNDTIDGEAGQDIIGVGGGANTVFVSTAGDTATLTFNDNDTSTSVTDDDTITGSFDVISSFSASTDFIDISGVNAATTAGNIQAGLAADEYHIIRGDWDDGTFTVDATGADTLVAFDDTANDVAVVLLGITNFTAADLT